MMLRPLHLLEESPKPRRRLRRIGATRCAVLIVTALSSATPLALAQEEDTVSTCLSKHTEGQQLRLEHRLVESREAFRQCSAPECPNQVIRDCLEWAEQYQRQIPSISIRVKVDHQDRPDARVFIDGTPVLDRLSGKAVDLDPGVHRIRIEIAGLAPVEREVVVNEGEQYRIVDIEIEPPKPRPLPESAPASAPEPARHRPIPMASYVFAGLSVAAAGSGIAWGLSMRSLHDELEKDCAPLCSEQRVDTLERRALFADLSFGVSALSLATAVTLYVLRPEEPLEDVHVDVRWLPSGGALGSLSLPAF